MKLSDFFSKYNQIAIGFSGGVDSAYLTYNAKKYAKELLAIYYKSEFQPEFELRDARRFCQEYKIPLKIIYDSVLTDSVIAKNPKNRCYYCKQRIFTAIQNQAQKEGFSVLLDGTNASDSADDRPGMIALEELAVLSPLRLCGLTKENIRLLSKEAGLFTWNKPAYACLATRIPSEMKISAKLLHSVEICENLLFSMGFHDFRVRVRDNYALLQVSAAEFSLANQRLNEIRELFLPYFKDTVLDSNTR